MVLTYQLNNRNFAGQSDWHKIFNVMKKQGTTIKITLPKELTRQEKAIALHHHQNSINYKEC